MQIVRPPIAIAFAPLLAFSIALAAETQRSPFDAVKINGETPHVKVGDTWYELLALDKVPAEKIVRHCMNRYQTLWIKRFREDLVLALNEMGHKPGAKVALRVKNLETGAIKQLTNVPMTRQKRQKLWKVGWQPDTSDKKRSPFDGLKMTGPKGETPHVKIGEAWYELLALNGIPAKKIVAHCMKRHGGIWLKRFKEDLVPALEAMGHEPGPHVSLKVKDLTTGAVKVLPRVSMTHEKRQRLRSSSSRAGRARRTGRADRGGDIPRISREHKKGDAQFAFLTSRYRDRPSLPAARAQHDLDQLEWLVENVYSYRDMKKVDYRTAFDTIRAKLGEGIDARDFLLQTRKLVALFGDGHSRVRGGPGAMKGGGAPFRVVRVGARVALLDSARNELLVDGFPYVRSIDGVGIEKWLTAAERYNARGSAHFMRRMAIEYLCFVRHLRLDLGLTPAAKLEIVVESEEGRRTKTTTASLARRFARYRGEKRPAPATVTDGIGYLRIPEMTRSPEAIANIHQTMDAVRKTRGLIIDVRDNGGGTRDILRTLFPYFMRQSDPPHVVNVAKYRLQPGDVRDDEGGHLRNRALFPAGWKRWSKAARKSIGVTAAKFKADWTPDPKAFSDWHYMVIEPTNEPPYYHYAKPVIVLLDEGCYSATDIFLGAFAGWRNVTLMGMASGGGSGRAREYRLKNTRFKVRFSSMASFRPDGRRYDGLGIEPDVEMDATLTDRLGETDTVLDAARKRLGKQ